MRFINFLFVIPAKAGIQVNKTMTPDNIFSDISENISKEIFETIISSEKISIERITSKGQSSPEGFWYDQEKNEWVILLKGAARIRFENQEKPVHLKPGDYINISAHCRHRVEWTDPDCTTIWIAVFY
jgi:cupin 2 domain-containing protein